MNLPSAKLAHAGTLVTESPLRDLEAIIRSRTPLIAVESNEEPQIVRMVRQIGQRYEIEKLIGSGAVGWFNPQTDTGRNLTADFDEFHYAANTWSLNSQLDWLRDRLAQGSAPTFAFLNVGETHVPYYHQGASWSEQINPCVPFGKSNDAAECRRRQLGCVSFVDQAVAPLLDAFSDGTVVICADHGDCWGEDGLWEHGISHQKVLEVPLIYRLGKRL